MKSLRSNYVLPLAAIPALLVTGAALVVLVAGVAGAATTSQPGELLYTVRRPALMLELAPTNDPAQRTAIETLLAEPAAPSNVVSSPALEPAPGAATEGGGEQVDFSGTISFIGDGFIVAADQTVYLSGAQINGQLAVGTIVNIFATRDGNGRLVAREVTVPGISSGNPGPGGNTNGNANTNDSENQNGNVNANVNEDQNGNVNENENQNGNVNINDNENGNVNANSNSDDDDNSNSGGGNFNSNSNANTNSNFNSNANSNSNFNTNTNSNTNVNSNFNSNTDSNSNSNDDDSNSGGGGGSDNGGDVGGDNGSDDGGDNGGDDGGGDSGS